jgi:hypothetical protein
VSAHLLIKAALRVDTSEKAPLPPNGPAQQ